MRKKRKRRVKPKAFILCNGVKSEYNYFKGLRSHLGREGSYLIDIVTIKGDPISVIEKILDKKVDLKNHDEEIDKVFFVFDIDEFYDQKPQEFINMIKLAVKSNIQLVTSNPSFEYWILLHLKETYSEANATKILNQLKKEFQKQFSTNYRKNSTDIYDKLVPFETSAIKRAKKNKKTNDNIKKLLINPSTYIPDLIKLLKNTNHGS